MGGGDKCLMELDGSTLLRRLIDRAAPQTSALVLNTNSDPALFASYGLPVAADAVDGYAGPLAGVLTGLEWAAGNLPGCVWVASFACDAPFAPRDLVLRLLDAVRRDNADMACATSAGRDHPVFGLWPVACAAELRAAIVDDGVRKVDAWTSGYRLARADFATGPVDPFFNINRPDDLAQAARLLAST